MKVDPERQELLNDVLAEGEPPGFREEVLSTMLAEVHHRNWQRQRNRRLMAGACVVVGLVLASIFFRGAKDGRDGQTEPFLVHSQPLTRTMVVATQPQAIGKVHTTSDRFVVVRTQPGDRLFETIGDEKLLALLAGRPAVLVHHGPVDKELILLNSQEVGW
ncbi:MAG TPA: hypothetical protein VEC99_01360 [Clostridia bacterium]|nr:hypothetical protein [Clostridia bacterium]